MVGENGVTRCIINEHLSSYIQGGQKKGGSGVTRRIIDEIHSSDIQRDQMEG